MSHLEELRYRYNQTPNPSQKKLLTIEKAEQLLQLETPINELSHIVVLGASMDYHNGQWNLGTVVESDHGYLVGGWTRVLAANQLLKEGFEGTFLVTGGTQHHKGLEESRAQILANYMHTIGDVPKSQIEVIGTNRKGNTLGNVTNTKDYLISAGITGDESIGILTNEWHIERSLLMFLSDAFFEEYRINVFPVNADDVLYRIPEGYFTHAIEEFQNHPLMEERLMMELQGMFDLLVGKYKPLSS